MPILKIPVLTQEHYEQMVEAAALAGVTLEAWALDILDRAAFSALVEHDQAQARIAKQRQERTNDAPTGYSRDRSS